MQTEACMLKTLLIAAVFLSAAGKPANTSFKRMKYNNEC